MYNKNLRNRACCRFPLYFALNFPENVYSALNRHLARVRWRLIFHCSLDWWYMWQMRTLKDAVCPPRAAEINHYKLVTTDCFPLLRMPEVLSKSFLVALIVDLWQHTLSFCLCLHMAFSSFQFCPHDTENPLRGCRMTLSQYGERIFVSYTFDKELISRIHKEKKKESRKQMT